MYCPSCGAENEDARPLCYQCGVSLRNLQPLKSRLPVLQGQSGFLRWLLLLLIVGLAVLAVVFALRFSLAPDPRPLPTPEPTWQARQESAPPIADQPLPTPTVALPAELTGRVMEREAAQPLVNAQVIVGSRMAFTDELGRFAFTGLAPGQYVVAVVQPGYAVGVSPVLCASGGETQNVEIVLAPDGEAEEPVEPLDTNAMAPEGALTEDDARRLAQEQGLNRSVVEINPVTLRGKYWVNYRSAEGLGAAMVALDEPGWALSDDGGQVWRIVQRSGGLALPVPAGWAPPVVDVSEKGGHLAPEERPSSGATGALSQVHGQVVDEASGAPLAGAEVTVGEQQATTDAEGRFAVAELAPGSYTVLVTAEGYDPLLSGIVALAPGEQSLVDAALPAAGAGEYPRDPMASNQIDPAGAPSAGEAERLARLQGLQGEVTSIREVVLVGEYLVNYRKGTAIRAAVATLNHPGWELVDAAGQSWYVVRVCGNLAVARQATGEVPAQVVAQPHPVVTVGSTGAVGRACPEEGCDAVAELPGGWHGVALGCSPGCAWLQVQGPGVSGTCWVRADLVQPYGDVAGLPVASQSQVARIAYEQEGDIWLINPDGSDPSRLTNVGSYRSPAWSPDGRRIVVAYSSLDYMTIPTNLHIIDVETGQIAELTHYTLDDPRPVWITALEWSPDGSTIVYMQSGDGLGRHWEVASVGSDGSNPGRQLPIEQGHNALYPAWVPDGQRITYGLVQLDPIITRPADNFGIWVVGIDGSGARQLTIGDTGISSWSADGAWIAYDSVWGLDSDIHVMRADGTGSRTLTSGGISSDPHWSPDGSQIVFVRVPQPGAPEIWLMNADGSDPHKLTDGSAPAWQPVAVQSAPTPIPSPSSSIPEIRWSEPELIGGEGQGGPTQQLLLDPQGQLWAIWEHHASPGTREHPYEAVHYRIWDGQAWDDLQDIPHSQEYGEPTATLLPDGAILVKAETTMDDPYRWFQWDGSRWSDVPEMASLQPLNEGIRAIAADSHGYVHVLGYPIRTWDGTSWRETEKLGSILYHATVLDTQGILHVAGSTWAAGSDQHIRKWVWDGNSWSVSGDIYTLAPEADTGFSPPSLAIGPDGTFHVVWAGSNRPPPVTGTIPPLPHWVSYSRGREDQWSEPQAIFGPVTVGAGGWDPNLAVAPDGTVIVVWGDVELGAGYRAYATWGREDKWVEPVVLSPEDGDQHMWPVVAMDAAGHVHVIWKARTGIYHVLGTVVN